MASNATAALPPYLQEQLAHISDDRRTEFVAATAVCLSLAWIAVGLRFLARYCSTMLYGWDDWTLIPALILASASSISACVGVLFGSGRHVIVVLQDPTMLTSYGKTIIASETIYNPSIFVIKLSILLLYARIFPNKNFRICAWAIGTFTAAYTLCAMIVTLTQCIPLDVSWNRSAGGTCNVNMITALTVFGALNIATDFAILMMPIPMIWNLHATLNTKVQISGLFLTGALVTVTSITRVVYISRTSLQDPTWDVTDPSIWTVAELSTAIISACLPTYRPLFDKTKRKTPTQNFWSTSSRVYSKTDGGGGEIGESLQKIHVQTSISNVWSDKE